MAKVLYTAHAHVTGGRDGHGHTSDSELELNLRVPKEMGGTRLASKAPSPRSLGAVTWTPVRSRSTLR